MSRDENFDSKRKIEKNMDAITIKLKKMLLSRNVVLQDQCIQFMIRSLKDPKQFGLVSTTFLNADMVQYLCEPLLSINTTLIQNICLCVWMLSKNRIFYERNDILYTCNSVMRTLVFLISTKDTSVSNLIQLLAILIKKGGTNLQEICNMPQMLSIIKIIFINSQDLPSCCVINAISILSHFLSCPSVELSSKLYNTSMSISEEICKSVTGKCIIDSYVVDISSNLSCGLLRLYSTIASRILLNEHLQKHKKVAKSLKNIAWFMIKHIILPFVLKNMNVSLHYKSCRKGIKSLLSPFRESLPLDVLQNIANYYAASKIISILFESIEYKQIGILSEELLFEMMFHLSSAYLKIDSHWPGGIDMFRNQLVWSFKDFPRTSKDICLILTNSKNTDIKQSIIIFIYFYLLTYSNIENESIYLEPICVYLCLIQNEIPTPVIKAVLFIISISFVSHNAVNAVSGLTIATKKLVALINTQMFDLIFTYHPAILYFLFATSIIPDKIQSQLIKQWILNLDDISFIELEKFCLKNDKAKLCLLNVLINDTTIDSNKLHLGFDVIKKIIAIENNLNEHKTLLIIWEILPINLGLFCCTENPKAIGATNLKLLLNLTESCSFDGLNICINEHRNLVYTMSSIVKSYQSNFPERYSLLSSLLQHILTLIQLSNNDVVNTIKKHNDFLCVLQKLCLSENNEVCFLTYNTIIKLCQIEKEGIKNEYTILNSMTINCNYILDAMSRKCQNCIISSITLFQIIIHYYEKCINDTVEFNDILTVECFRSVFIQLKTLISQGLDWVSDHAWECITIILSTSLLKDLKNIPDLQYELATDPWLNFLLTNYKFYNKKCLKFLHFWFDNFVLTTEESFSICGKEPLCPSIFDKTIIHILSTIVNQTYKSSELVMEAKSIINLILKSKFVIPNGLEFQIQHFLNQQQ